MQHVKRLYLQPLRVLQNRAIRFISRAPRFRRLDNDYLNLRLLKLDDLYQLSIYKFMHQYFNDKLPSYFSNFFLTPNNSKQNTRRNGILQYQPIQCKKKIMERSVRFVGPKLWQNIPVYNRYLSGKLFKIECVNALLAK